MAFTEDFFIKGIGIAVFFGVGVVSYYLAIQERKETKSLKDRMDKSIEDLTKQIDDIRAKIRYKNESDTDTFESAGDSYYGDMGNLKDIEDFGERFTLNPEASGMKTSTKLSIKDLCEQSDKFHQGDDGEKAEGLKLLKEYKNMYEEKYQYLWRLARAHVSLYDISDSDEVRRNHSSDALQYSERALKLQDNSSDVYKWYALSLGSTIEFLATKEKIETCYELKKLIDQAIKLNVDDAMLRYTRGRWFYGVYQLSWIERTLAGKCFAEPPTATIEEAVSDFRKAEELLPNTMKSNLYYLAKCEHVLGNREAVSLCLEQANRLPIRNKDDQESHKQCQDMANRLSIFLSK